MTSPPGLPSLGGDPGDSPRPFSGVQASLRSQRQVDGGAGEHTARWAPVVAYPGAGGHTNRRLSESHELRPRTLPASHGFPEGGVGGRRTVLCRSHPRMRPGGTDHHGVDGSSRPPRWKRGRMCRLARSRCEVQVWRITRLTATISFDRASLVRLGPLSRNVP